MPYRFSEDSGAEEDTERGEAMPAEVPWRKLSFGSLVGSCVDGGRRKDRGRLSILTVPEA